MPRLVLLVPFLRVVVSIRPERRSRADHGRKYLDLFGVHNRGGRLVPIDVSVVHAQREQLAIHGVQEIDSFVQHLDAAPQAIESPLHPFINNLG